MQLYYPHFSFFAKGKPQFDTIPRVCALSSVKQKTAVEAMLQLPFQAKI